MIARADGLVVLVSGAIPGERVRAKIERVGKGVAYAAAVDIEEPSGDRRAAGGDPLCGGCLYAHIAYPRQLELKALVIADAFARIGRIELPAAVRVAPSPEEGYRMRRAAARARPRGSGSFAKGTHEVCDARQTRQLLPATSDALDRLVAAAHSLGARTDAGVARSSSPRMSMRRSASCTSTSRRRPASWPSRVARTARRDGRPDRPGGAGRRSRRRARHRRDHDRRSSSRSRFVATCWRSFRATATCSTSSPPTSSRRCHPAATSIDLYAGVGVFADDGGGDSRRARDGGRRRSRRRGRSDGECRRDERRCCRRPPIGGGRFVDAASGGLSMAGATVIVDPPRTGMSREALDGICRLHGAANRLRVVRRRHARARCAPPRRQRVHARAGGRVRSVSQHAARRDGAVRNLRTVSFDWRDRPCRAGRDDGGAVPGRLVLPASSRNPSNSARNSPVRQKFSGCHWTPRQKRAAGSSIASMTPSGAVADTR